MSLSGAVVCDTGPLISLERLNSGRNFMRELHSTLLIPTTVAAELCQGTATDWVTYEQKYDLVDFAVLVKVSAIAELSELASLDLGE